MIRATTDNDPPQRSSDRSSDFSAERKFGNPYGRIFWLCYLSNTCIMLAISLMFRYAGFIQFYGGTEFHLGWIVGLAMVGSLLMRSWQAAAIDRYGTRLIWIGSLILFIVSLLGHLFIYDVRSLPIFGLRILYQVGIAGMFGASITFISRTVPINRMGEIIGVLGTSGFVGMAFGPWLGDLLFGESVVTEAFIQKMFIYAVGLAVVALIAAWVATAKQPRVTIGKKPPPLWWLLKKYNPGSVLLMGVAIGIGVTLPGVFLWNYALSLDIHQLRIFFATYAFIAFTVRMLTHQLPDRIGYRPMILLGMVCLVSSLFLYLIVDTAWGLVIPASVAGTAHAFLFPSVVASCSVKFPQRYRGLGTTLALAAFDLGALIGMPLVGLIISYSEYFDLPAYPIMFITTAILLSIMTMIYAFRSRSTKRQEDDYDDFSKTEKKESVNDFSKSSQKDLKTMDNVCKSR